MAYTICDEVGTPKPIRLLIVRNDQIRVGEPFRPYWWLCDPCAPAARRYEVQHRADSEAPAYYRWYEVVTSDDTKQDVDAKIAHYGKVLAAYKAMDAARVEIERLNGVR